MQWLIDALKDIWETFVVYFDMIVAGFWEYIEVIVVGLKLFFGGFVGFFVTFTLEIVKFLYGLLVGEEYGIFWTIFDFMIWLGDSFLEVMPDLGAILGQYSDTLDWAIVWIGMLNLFFPVVESVVLLGTLVSLAFIVIFVRWVIKFFPGTGN